MICRSDKAQRNAGFSLVELLGVIAVMALIAAIALPNFSAPSGRLAFESQVRSVHDMLELASARAVATRRPVPVTFDLDKRTVAANGETRILDNTILLRVRVAADSGNEADRGRIVFMPDGTSTGGRIEMARGERHSILTVNWLTSRIGVEYARGG